VNKKQVYDVYSAAIHLRNSYPTFYEGQLNHSLSQMNKRLTFTHDDMDAVVLCNFAVNAAQPLGGFTQTGWWYEYFSGDSLMVENVNMQVPMNSGEYKVYTTEKLPTPNVVSTVGLEDFIADNYIESLYPNPSSTQVNLVIAKNVIPVKIYILQMDGTIVREIQTSAAHEIAIDVSDLAAGKYFVYVESLNRFSVKPLVVQ
jgi:hypothetical protein